MGHPNTVSVSGDAGEADPEGELSGPEQQPEPEVSKPVTSKGLMCVNLGLGMGGDTIAGGLPGREGHHYFFPNQAEFDYCASLGIPKTRCGFLSERAVPGPAGKGKVSEEHALQMIRTARYAKNAGIKVLWDMHNYSGHSTTNKSGDRKRIGTSEYPTEALGEMWFKLLDRLLQDPDFQDATYGLDTMNEPIISWAEWKPALQHAVNRIAEVAPGYMVICEGIKYANTPNFVTNNPGAETITHPHGKAWLEWHGHLYLDNGQDGFWTDAKETKDQVEADIGLKRIKPFADWGKKHGLKLGIGETNVPGIYPNHQRELDKMLAFCVENGIDVYPFYIARNAAGSWHDLQKPENKSTLDIIKKYSMVQR
jgi:endoglucanase